MLVVPSVHPRVLKPPQSESAQVLWQSSREISISGYEPLPRIYSLSQTVGRFVVNGLPAYPAWPWLLTSTPFHCYSSIQANSVPLSDHQFGKNKSSIFGLVAAWRRRSCHWPEAFVSVKSGGVNQSSGVLPVLLWLEGNDNFQRWDQLMSPITVFVL